MPQQVAYYLHLIMFCCVLAATLQLSTQRLLLLRAYASADPSSTLCSGAASDDSDATDLSPSGATSASRGAACGASLADPDPAREAQSARAAPRSPAAPPYSAAARYGTAAQPWAAAGPSLAASPALMEVSCAALPAAAASEQAQWRALAAGAEAGFRVGGEAAGLESPGEAGEGGAAELSAGCSRHWAPAEAAAAAAPLCAAMDVDEARLQLRGMDADTAGVAVPPATSQPGRGADPEHSAAAAPGADRGGRFMAELAAAMAARRDERGAAGGRSPLALALEARPRKRMQARLVLGYEFRPTLKI